MLRDLRSLWIPISCYEIWDHYEYREDVTRFEITKYGNGTQPFWHLFTIFVQNSQDSQNSVFHDYIRDHHGECIQISTNIPGISFVSLEIDFGVRDILWK